MNQHAIDARINDLNLHMDGLKQRREEIEKEISKTQGRLDEMWEWHKAENKGIKMPVFGDVDKLEEAIASRGKSMDGLSVQDAKDARVSLSKRDGQSAVDEMDGMPE